MSYVHERGIVHRDLKPANVMVDEFDGVKIMDFGLAREIASKSAPPSYDGDGIDPTADLDEEIDNLTRTGTIVGTPLYASPEQVRDSSDVDHRADVYSLGAMLYEILTGRSSTKRPPRPGR